MHVFECVVVTMRVYEHVWGALYMRVRGRIHNAIVRYGRVRIHDHHVVATRT
jgi:hypothetical protein